MWIKLLYFSTFFSESFLKLKEIYEDLIFLNFLFSIVDFFTCIPEESLLEINHHQVDVLPSFIKLKRNCVSCCPNSLFQCQTPSKVVKIKRYNQFSRKSKF